MPDPLTFATDVVVDATPEELWPYISDTDRINRSIGLPPVTYQAKPRPQGGVELMASAKLGPLPLRWREHPFEWVRHEGLSVEREYLGGPLERMTGIFAFERIADGRTRVHIEGRFVPRSGVGVVVAHLVGRKALSDFTKSVARVEEYLKGRARGPFAPYGVKSHLNEEALLASAVRIEHDLKQRIVGKFLEYCKEAPDEGLIRMRPFALADRWGENRMDVLKAFLAATQVGILDMKCFPICPHCRGAKGEVATLKDLRDKGFCDACHLEFKLDFDQAVEVRFTIHPIMRKTVDATYCIGGPANTRHILCQARIPAGATRSISLTSDHDRYRIRSPQVAGSARIEWIEGSEDRKNRVLALPDGFQPAELLYTGGRVELEVVNECEGEMLFVLEEEAWEEKAASAAMVTSLQDFRDMFDAEVLAPENELAVRSLAIVFSDLKSSTELYEKVGDARAYALVRQHFEFLEERIRAHDGSIVKTIGDAVMAVFTSGRAAVATCLDIQEKVMDFNARQNMVAAISLKLGAHRGSVIAVNSNDRLDYFGRTVNVAARLHGESHGGDVILSENLYEDAEIDTLLKNRRVTTELFTVSLKGVAQAHRLMRVKV